MHEKLSSDLRMCIEAYAHRINKYNKILPYDLRKCINKKKNIISHMKGEHLFEKFLEKNGIMGNVYRSSELNLPFTSR